MKNLLGEKVIAQQIAGVSMENYMADLLEKLEKNEIDQISCENKIKAYKQLNVRHKNIIDAQRVINKSLEMEISMLSQGN